MTALISHLFFICYSRKPSFILNGRRLFSVLSHALVQHTKQSSSVGKHFINEHCIVLKDLYRHFFVLRKCMSKFDCLVHEMLLIGELTPSLNVQWDSIQAELFA